MLAVNSQLINCINTRLVNTSHIACMTGIVK